MNLINNASISEQLVKQVAQLDKLRRDEMNLRDRTMDEQKAMAEERARAMTEAPDEDNVQVREVAFHAFQHELRKWLISTQEKGKPIPEAELRRCLDGAWKILKREHNLDAFHLGVEFKDDLWEVAMDLVNVLEGWETDVMHAQDLCVEAWVKLHGVKPKLKIGDSVTTILSDRKEHTGTIVGIDEKRAQYQVKFPGELGDYLVTWEAAEAKL